MNSESTYFERQAELLRLELADERRDHAATRRQRDVLQRQVDVLEPQGKALAGGIDELTSPVDIARP